MNAVIYLIYLGPPAVALILAANARSRVARWLLVIAAVLSITLFALISIAEADCARAEFTFLSCDRLPDAFGDIMGPVQVLFVIGYVFGGPAILAIAAIFEWLARRKASGSNQP